MEIPENSIISRDRRRFLELRFLDVTWLVEKIKKTFDLWKNFSLHKITGPQDVTFILGNL